MWILAATAWILGWAVYLSVYMIRFGETANALLSTVILLGPPAALLTGAEILGNSKHPARRGGMVPLGAGSTPERVQRLRQW